MNELKSESIIFDKLPNEVMSNLYVFSSRILNGILRDVDDTGIVTIYGKMFLMNTIIKEEFYVLKNGPDRIGRFNRELVWLNCF